MKKTLIHAGDCKFWFAPYECTCGLLSGVGPDPVARDLRAYTTAGAAMFVGLICVALMGGLMLKQDRKVGPTGIVHAGCYKWSDGQISCAHGWRSMTDDKVYGCTWANSDPATGECK